VPGGFERGSQADNSSANDDKPLHKQIFLGKIGGIHRFLTTQGKIER
jgi:hypothetical protein